MEGSSKFPARTVFLPKLAIDKPKFRKFRKIFRVAHFLTRNRKLNTRKFPAEDEHFHRNFSAFYQNRPKIISQNR